MRTIRAFANASAEDIIRQAGCIPLRINDEGHVEVCLVNTTRSGKWGIPKGTVKKKEGVRETAIRETYEECGLKGLVGTEQVGSYDHRNNEGQFRRVAVFYMFVTKESLSYPEFETRKKKWVSVQSAAKLVPRIRFILSHNNVREFIKSVRHETD